MSTRPRNYALKKSPMVRIGVPQQHFDAILDGHVPDSFRVSVVGNVWDGITITPVKDGDKGVIVRASHKTGGNGGMREVWAGSKRLGANRDERLHTEPKFTVVKNTRTIHIAPVPELAAQTQVPAVRLKAQVLEPEHSVPLEERKTQLLNLKPSQVKRVRLLMMDLNELVHRSAGAMKLKLTHGVLSATVLQLVEVEI